MPLTDPERRALRRRSTVIVPGFRPLGLAEECRRLAVWCEANGVEHDIYGDGDLVGAFEAKIAALLGKAAAVFVPSGTMAQLAAVRVWCERAKLERFGLHPTSHLVLHEEDAYAAVMRLHAVPIGNRLRPMVASDLDAVREPLACALIELPIREAGGQLPSWDELEALKRTAAEHGIPLHMDGARLWESAAFYRRSHAEIADGFGSVYVSVYKGIGGLAGALLAGDEDLVARARLWRKRMGGTLVRLGPFVASAAMRFDERLASMPALYERTLRFAARLQTVPDLRINPSVPQTNMLHLYLDAASDRLLEERDRIAARTGTWLFDRARPADVPGWSVSEVYVGDALLAIEDDESIAPLFAELIEAAKAA